MDSDARRVAGTWLIVPVSIAVEGIAYWYWSGSDFFDAGPRSWVLVAVSATASAFGLFLLMRVLKIASSSRALVAAVLAWSLWMLGLPGLAYLGLLILLPLELLLSGLAIDFGARVGMARSLALAAVSRWSLLFGLLLLASELPT